jgi:hypothetical protein
MSTDPIARLPVAFGKLLNKLRVKSGWEEVTFVAEAGLTSAEKLASLEGGEAEPTKKGEPKP